MPKSTSLWIDTAHRSADCRTESRRLRRRLRGRRRHRRTDDGLSAGPRWRVGRRHRRRPRRQRADGRDDRAPVVVIDDTFKEMLRLHGPDGARLAYDSHASAIDAHRERSARDEHIDCRFERVDGYLFLGRKRQGVDPRRGARGRARGRRQGQRGCRRRRSTGFDERAVPAVSRTRGSSIRSKYLNGLAAAFQRRGGQIYSDTQRDRGNRRRRARASRRRPATRSGPSRSSSRRTRRSTISSPSTRSRRRTTPTRSARASPPARSRRRSTGTPRIRITTSGSIGRRTRELGGDNDDPVDILIVGGEDHKAGQAQDADARFARLEALDARALPRRRDGRVPLVRAGDGDGRRPRRSSAAIRSTPTTSTSSPATRGWA